MMEKLAIEYINALGLSLVASTTSVTLTKARVFRELREVVTGWNAWLGKLVHCPYCMSHWISLVLVMVYHPGLTHCGFPVLDDAVSVFIIVAMATVWSKHVSESLQTMDLLHDEGEDVP